MNASEFKEMLTNLFADADVDETNDENVQSNQDDGDVVDVDGVQNNTSSQDTRDHMGDGFRELIDRLNKRDAANVERIAALEKKIAQLANKAPATNEAEQSQDTPEEHTPLFEMDFATPAPKI